MKSILDKWKEINSEESEYSAIREGVSNDVYLTEDYVYKYNEYYEGLKAEFQVMECLFRNNLSVPEPVYTSENHGISVYKRINGESVNSLSKKRKLDLSELLGGKFRAMHEEDFSQTDLDKLGDLIPSYGDYKSIRNKFIQSAKRFNDDSMFNPIVMDCCKQLRESSTSSDYRESILHMDYHNGNVMNSNKELYIIDFEHSIISHADIDFVHAFLRLKKDNTEEFVNRFVQGYGKKIGDVDKPYRCLGCIHEGLAARWWEKNYERDMSHRYNILREFVDNHIND